MVSRRVDSEIRESADRYPIRCILFGCCASANEIIDSSTLASRPTIVFIFLVCLFIFVFTESPDPLSPAHLAES
jgi:hypothetical protein